MKKFTLVSVMLLLIGMNAIAQQDTVKGEILADTNNAVFLKVWGNAEERGYAYGYLLNESIIEISEGYIRLSLGSSCRIRWDQVATIPTTPLGKRLYSRSLVWEEERPIASR